MDTLPLEPSVEVPLVVENDVVVSTSPANEVEVEEKGNTLVIENEVVVSTTSVSDSAMEEKENTYPNPVHNTNQCKASFYVRCRKGDISTLFVI